MSNEIQNEITNLFNTMAMGIFQTIILYFVLPFLAILLFCRFVLKIKGKFLQIILYIAALGCLYFFAMHGLPEMQMNFSKTINN